MEKKLGRTAPKETAAAIAGRMEELGLVDDAAYARRLAADLAVRKLYSRRRVIQELRARGVADGQKENARMESEVFERIRDYLADQLDVDPEKITPDSDIVEDFGADSLDVVDMITTLSDEFGVDIPDEEIENFHTVGDVVQYVEDRI